MPRCINTPLITYQCYMVSSIIMFCLGLAVTATVLVDILWAFHDPVLPHIDGFFLTNVITALPISDTSSMSTCNQRILIWIQARKSSSIQAEGDSSLFKYSLSYFKECIKLSFSMAPINVHVAFFCSVTGWSTVLKGIFSKAMTQSPQRSSWNTL